jgi:outer membrane biosynthesis protein TonB
MPIKSGVVTDSCSEPNIHARNPKYVREARATGHQGTSILSLTVATDGYTRDINVVRKLDTELDDSAIAPCVSGVINRHVKVTSRWK